MPLYIVDKNIATMNVDAAVTLTDKEMHAEQEIAQAVDREKLRPLWKEIREHIHERDIFITPADGLSAQYLIYETSPEAEGLTRDLHDYVQSCRRCIQFAAMKGFSSIAFPLNVYAPEFTWKNEVAEALWEGIGDLADRYGITVYLCANSEIQDRYSIWRELDERLFEHLTEEQAAAIRKAIARRRYIMPPPVYAQYGWVELPEDVVRKELAALLENRTLSFSDLLSQFMEKEGLSDPDVYNAALLDRRHFAKLKKSGAAPQKRTVLALVLGLKLNIKEATKFLKAAGYAFSDSDPTDIIIKYFLEDHMYDVAIINSYLVEYGQEPLGSRVRD